jgi:hypothetical protein
VLWKGDRKPIAITLYLQIGSDRIERVCKGAGISAAKFEELYRNSVSPTWMPSALIH